MAKKKVRIVPKRFLKTFSTDALAYMAADLMNLSQVVDTKQWNKIHNPVFTDIMAIGTDRLGEQEFSSKVAQVVIEKRNQAKK